MDEPLAEYPVIAEDLAGGEPTGLVLCEPCHRKLERVLAAVLEGGHAPGLAAEADTEALVAGAADSPREPGGTAQPGPEGEPARGRDGGEADAGDGNSAPPTGEASPAPSDEREAEEADRHATDEEERSEAEEADRQAAEEGGSGPADGAETTVSALEYNKVVRLLKNREFPVDRGEIEAVAENAYDLAPGECAAIIDLAVDRGLVAEEDGRLSRPE